MENYELIRELGEGSYGKVFLAKIKKSSEQVALKEIQISHLSPQEREKSKREVELLAKLSHPNIVALHQSFVDGGTLWISMEYVDGGDLYEKISKRQIPFQEDEILKIFIQIVFALKFIHGKKIVHRDIKPQNIFLTRLGIVKIGDFGVSRALEGTSDMCKTVVGTPYYLSPEVWSNQPYSTKTDIWSLGCIVYEMCMLKRPFTGRTPQQLFASVIRGQYERVSTRYSQALRNLIGSMLSPDPNNRPSPEQILEIPFIMQRARKLVSENQSQLKTVNIIARKRHTKKKVSSQCKKRVAKQQLPVIEESPLPLPDEEPPRWAQRGPALQKTDPVMYEEEDLSEPNEWDDLKSFTEQLNDSISRSNKSQQAPENEALNPIAAQKEIDSILASLSHFQPMLLSMLEDNINNESSPSCHEFVEIMESSDPEAVEKMRRVVYLKKFLKQK